MPVTNGIIGTEVNFKLQAGNSWIYSCQIKDFAGNPLDLTTAASIVCVIREELDETSPIMLQFALGDGIQIGSVGVGDNSRLDISKVLAVSKTKGYYEVKAIFPNDLEASVIYGKHEYRKKVVV